jgi:predicted nucleic acid-binding protein
VRRRALRTGRFLHRVRPRRSNGTARKFDVAGPWDVSVELADASKPPPFLLRPDRDTSRNTCGPCEGTGMTRFVIDAPVAIDLAADGATIPPEHSLVAPTLLRSQALALVYESVRRGEIDERIGRKVLDDIRGLRIRLLGDRVLQDHAWRIAAKLNWPDTYQAEYIALTQLQADALATADRKLAAAARAFVETVSPADILRP